jgi:predicted phage-related endonuclease
MKGSFMARENLGGSAANRIANGDAYGLWEEMTGRKEQDNLDDIFRVQLGVFTEPFNLSWFEKQTGLTVNHDVAIYHKEFPYFVAHLDGQIDGSRTPMSKLSTQTPSIVTSPAYYYAQLQFYVWMSDAEEIHLSIIRGNEYSRELVARDDDYLDALIDSMHHFQTCLEDDRPPSERPLKAEQKNIVLDNMRVADMTGDNQWGSEAAEWLAMKPIQTTL